MGERGIVGKVLSVASEAVPWALTLLGVPIPALTGGLSTVNAVVNALPKDRKALKRFVQAAANDFDDHCAHEVRELAEADRDSVVERLVALLGEGDRQRLLGAAVIGESEFRAAVLPEGSDAGLGDDKLGFLVLLLARVHGLVLHLAQSPEVIGVASTSALRLTWAQLMLRPTTDQVQRLIQQAVAGELRTRQLIVGTRPRLAVGFVPRVELDRLRDLLTDGGVATVCALRGMRGVGKSQLASAFAEECEHGGWRFVGWVTAPTSEQAVSELAEIARYAGVSAEDDPTLAARALVVWLSSSGPGDRLLVFDNVTDADHVKDLIPHGPGMRVLVTTTRGTSTLGTQVEMGAYTEDQAVTYLTSVTGLGDREGARLVAGDLGWLPVALAQAAVAMNLFRYNFGRYRGLLTERALDEVMHQEAGDSYPTRVGAALRLAYTGVLMHLDATKPAVGGAARAVLAALSLLAESGVPRDWFDRIADDELVVREALGELARHSVMTESADQTIVSLHRLQSQVIREDDTAQGRVHQAVRAGVAVLSSVDPDSAGDFLQRRAVCSLLGSQLSAIHHQGHSRALSDHPDLLETVGRVIYWAAELSDPYTAIALTDYSSSMERVLGADHPETLTLSHNLAFAYESAGQLGKAISLAKQTLAAHERVLGADHPDTLTSRSNLAYAYESAGELGKAIPLFEQTLADTERVLGADNPHTLAVSHTLAGVYKSVRARDRRSGDASNSKRAT